MRKKPYSDMDPLEEIRAIKEEMSREFPTAKALGEYLRNKYPDKDAQAESPDKKRRSAGKRNTAKRLTHA